MFLVIVASIAELIKESPNVKAIDTFFIIKAVNKFYCK